VGATLKDVAREAQVSMASVSRALNGTGHVTESIRARVLEVAARLHYVPNSGAQSLMTRRTRVVGVLLPMLHGEFFSELLRGMDIAARDHGLHLLVSSSHNCESEAGDALRAMIGRVDGLLVMSRHANGRYLHERLPEGLPVVLISTADADHTYASVYVDNYDGAYAMVEHLVGRGHRSIVHIAGPEGNIDAQERLRGYRDAMARHLPGAIVDIVQGDFTEESGHGAARQVLARPVRPDAIFAGNDMMAIGCLSALTDAGLAVPRDLALAGFDDIPTARFVVPPLTTVRVEISDLGASALERLAATIDHATEQPPDAERVPARLMIRASCGQR
jgi:LacI family transcriptional regulator